MAASYEKWIYTQDIAYARGYGLTYSAPESSDEQVEGELTVADTVAVPAVSEKRSMLLGTIVGASVAFTVVGSLVCVLVMKSNRKKNN